MKLERRTVFGGVSLLAFACTCTCGCANARRPASPPSTTTITSAPTASAPAQPASDADAAPRVGKAQRAADDGADSLDENAATDPGKDQPRRRDDRRGGFSGWK